VALTLDVAQPFTLAVILFPVQREAWFCTLPLAGGTLWR
jgi:hypothetical protein